MKISNYLFIGGSTGIGLDMISKLQAENHSITVLSRHAGPLNGIHGVTHHPFDILTEEIPPEWLPPVIDGLVYLPGTINLKPL